MDDESDFEKSQSRIKDTLTSFLSNPLSGNALRTLFGNNSSPDSTRFDSVSITTPPIRMNRHGTVTISHYMSYQSRDFVRYWTTILPDIADRYGNTIRYEHHDITDTSTKRGEYDIAAIGRALHHAHGGDVFWEWFDDLIYHGVESPSEAESLAVEYADSNNTNQADVSVNPDDPETFFHDVVEFDLYEDVIQTDVKQLFDQVDELHHNQLESDLSDGDPIFVLLVNGTRVSATYAEIQTEITQAVKSQM